MKLLIVLALFVASVANAEDQLCPIDEIGIHRADDPANDYVIVKWNGHKYRKDLEGRATDPLNDAIVTEWVLEIEENECNPSKSSRTLTSR